MSTSTGDSAGTRGDGDRERDEDGVQVVPVRLDEPGAVAPPPASPGWSAPALARPSRRTVGRAVAVVVLLALGAAGWARVQHVRSAHRDQAVTRAYLRYKAAAAGASDALRGYRPPAPVHASTCSFLYAPVCGWSSATPSATVAAVAASLRSRGFSVGTSRCDDRGTTNESCTVELVRGGDSVATLRSARDDVDYRLLGRPTDLNLAVSDVGDAPYTPPPAPTPMADASLAASAVSARLADVLRCTRPARGGCLEYTADATVPGANSAVWRAAGRLLVARGWWAVSGRCPMGYTKDCEVDVTRLLGPGSRDRVRVSETVAADGARSRVHVTVTELADRG